MPEVTISLLDDSGIETLTQMLKQKPLPYSLDKLEEDLRWIPHVDGFTRDNDGSRTTFYAQSDYLSEISDEEESEKEKLVYSVRINHDISIVELEVEPTEIVIENHYDRAKLEHWRDTLAEVRKAHMDLDGTLREFARANGYAYESPFKYKQPSPKEQIALPLQ